jgi:hypothetical protein
MEKVCDACAAFKRFGTKCYFYWENKKTCSQFQVNDFAEPSFKSVVGEVVWL